jgi:hypothetical protein
MDAITALVVETGGRGMSPETVAAIWGGISGGISGGVLGTLGSVLVLLLGRYLRSTGRLECIPQEWRLAWLLYRTPGANIPDDPVQGRVEKTYYQRFSWDNPLQYTNFAEYTLTVELRNSADVEVVLRDVHTAFVKGGGVLFTHRPFDVEKTADPSGVSEEAWKELPWADHTSPGMTMPGVGVEPVGTISLPSRSPVRVMLKGYVRSPDLHHIRGGYDEVRLRGTRGNGKLLDVPVPGSGYDPG